MDRVTVDFSFLPRMPPTAYLCDSSVQNASSICIFSTVSIAGEAEGYVCGPNRHLKWRQVRVGRTCKDSVFSGEDPKPQRGTGSYPRSHSQAVAKPSACSLPLSSVKTFLHLICGKEKYERNV